MSVMNTADDVVTYRTLGFSFLGEGECTLLFFIRDGCIILEESTFLAIIVCRFRYGKKGRYGCQVAKGAFCNRSCRFAHAKLIPTSF